jgi:hypothetical protein
LPQGKNVYVAWGEKDPDPDRDRYTKGDKGIIYRGQKGIDFFIDLMQGMTKGFIRDALKRNPKAFAAGNPAFGEWRRGIMQRQRDKNRAIMYPDETNRQS